MSGAFEWPWQYNFPPFFTLQPNADTRRKQLDAWCQLVLAFYQHHKQTTMDVQEAANSPLFHNKSLDRRLSPELIMTVLDELRKRGNLEWLDKGGARRRCRVVWRTPEEWGQLVHRWASANGMTNTVCTLFELTEGDDTEGEPFHGLDKDVLLSALRTLERAGKAELMLMGDAGEGVKFF